MNLSKYVNASDIAIVCLISSLFFTNSLPAQEGLKIGLSASPSVNWLRGDNASIENQGAKMGFEYGLFVDYGFSENTAFSTGFFVAHNGGKLNYVDTTGFTDYNFKFQYLNVPVTIKLKTNEIGPIRYFGQIGVLPGFRIRARANVNFNDSTSAENLNIIKSNVAVPLQSNLINVSLLVGAGIEYALGGNATLVAGLFFNNGFLNVIEDADDDKVVLRSVGLTAGVKF